MTNTVLRINFKSWLQRVLLWLAPCQGSRMYKRSANHNEIICSGKINCVFKPSLIAKFNRIAVEIDLTEPAEVEPCSKWFFFHSVNRNRRRSSASSKNGLIKEQSQSVLRGDHPIAFVLPTVRYYLVIGVNPKFVQVLGTNIWKSQFLFFQG